MAPEESLRLPSRPARGWSGSLFLLGFLAGLDVSSSHRGSPSTPRALLFFLKAGLRRHLPLPDSSSFRATTPLVTWRERCLLRPVCGGHAHVGLRCQSGQKSLMATSMPIDEVLGKLRSELETGSCVVLVAQPGAGKTTRVPLALLDAQFLCGQSIVLLEPRRLAARASASRMASTLSEHVGQTVGYRIRRDGKVSADTRIEEDPELSGVGMVIFDEFHERSLQADLGLALCRDAQAALRPDLRILIMSATLDAARVSHMLDGCPVITSQGRAFPVHVRHPSPAAAPARPLSIPEVSRAVADAVINALNDEEGSILAFLPGAPEIRRARTLLDHAGLPSSVEVHALYADLPQSEQDAAIRRPPDGRRKVVLATSIAETSLTIDGVRVVIDCGLKRTQRFDPRTGMGRLITDQASVSEMEQRRGRAGRTQPGVCWRLWREGGEATGSRTEIEPEILRADLAPLVLELAVWGASDVGDVSWLDAPPAKAVDDATALLESLGAVDANGVATAHGQRLCALPLHPRIAHMVVQGTAMGMGGVACDLAAVLQDRRQGRWGDGTTQVDLRERVEELQRASRGKGSAEGWTREAAKVSRDVARLVRRMATDGGGGMRSGEVEGVGELLALAYPERVAKSRGAAGKAFKMVNGGGVELPDADALIGSGWIVVSECDGQRGGGRVFGAAPIDDKTANALLAPSLRTEKVVEWNEDKGAVVCAERDIVGELVLRETAADADDANAVLDVVTMAVRKGGLRMLSWSPRAQNLVARVQLVRETEFGDDDWPDMSEGSLIASVDRWLVPFLFGITTRQQLAAIDSFVALSAMLTPDQSRLLGELCPEEVQLPTGDSADIDYTDSGGPTIRVALQQLLGASSLPPLLRGGLPLTAALLNPARRVIHVTSDLDSFWRGAYVEVRKEMRGRYPKHYWPEDPANATPSEQTTKKQRAAQGKDNE